MLKLLSDASWFFRKDHAIFASFPQFVWVPVPQIDKWSDLFHEPKPKRHHWSHQEGPEAGLQGWNVFNHTVHASDLAEHPAGWFNGFREWEFSREKTQNGSRSFLGAGAMWPCICNYMFCHVWFCIDTVYHMICHTKSTCKDKCAEGPFEPAVAWRYAPTMCWDWGI